MSGFEAGMRCGKQSCFPHLAQACQIGFNSSTIRAWRSQPLSLPYTGARRLTGSTSSVGAPHERGQTLLMLLLGGTLRGDPRGAGARCADVNNALYRRGGGLLRAVAPSSDMIRIARCCGNARRFLLEPGATRPAAAHLTDSLVLGCVYVLFTAIQDNAYGWLWPLEGGGSRTGRPTAVCERARQPAGAARICAAPQQVMQATIGAWP